MKELFEDEYINFFKSKSENIHLQVYYNYLAEVLKKGEGLLPNLQGSQEQLIERKLLPFEKKELNFQINLWLSSLN